MGSIIQKFIFELKYQKLHILFLIKVDGLEKKNLKQYFQSHNIYNL